MPDYALMNQCLYEGKAKEVEEMTKAALAEGRPVQEVLTDGLIAGMSVVGEDFKYNILYVLEVLIAARAMKAGHGRALYAAVREGFGGATRWCARDGNGARRSARHWQKSRVHDGCWARASKCTTSAWTKASKISRGLRTAQARHHRHERVAHHHDDLYENGHRWFRGKGSSSNIKMAIGGAPIRPDGTRTRSARTVTARTLRARWICFYILPAKARRRSPSPNWIRLILSWPSALKQQRFRDQRTQNQKYQVRNWQDLPSEIKAWDNFDEVKISLPNRFAEMIDASAQKQGFIQADSYMQHLRWSDEAERPGTPQEVVEAMKKELEAKFP